MRSGDVCALQRQDFDHNGKVLYSRHSVNRGDNDLGKARIEATKTASSMRNVPIPEGMLPLIRQHLETYCGPEPEAQVFRPKISQVLSQNTLNKQFRNARSLAGRPEITFHTLRASHATLLILCGGTLRESMNELGHSSTEVAIQHYQRTVPEHQQAVVNELANKMLPHKRTAKAIAEELSEASRQQQQWSVKAEKLRRELRTCSQALESIAS